MNENALFLNHGVGTNATDINCLGLVKQLRGKNIGWMNEGFLGKRSQDVQAKA